MGCLFCDIVAKKVPANVVYENEHVVAFKDIRPVAPTHVLVIPKEHVASLQDLTPDHLPAIGHVMLGVRHVAAELGLADGFRTVINSGDAAGQTVHHIHAHLLGGRTMTWPPG
jgi:histidine triad (HIT) family protein